MLIQRFPVVFGAKPRSGPIRDYQESPQGKYEKDTTQAFFALLQAWGYRGPKNAGSGLAFPAKITNGARLHLLLRSAAEEQEIRDVLSKIARMPHQEIREERASGQFYYRGYPIELTHTDLASGHR